MADKGELCRGRDLFGLKPGRLPSGTEPEGVRQAKVWRQGGKGGRTGSRCGVPPDSAYHFPRLRWILLSRLSQAGLCLAAALGSGTEEMMDAFGQRPLLRSLGNLSKAGYL